MSIFLRDESGMPDDRQLTRYLLGLLPDREAERLDEASVADDDFAARLRIAETDLVDSYVVGALEGDTLKRFESHYLSSPLRRRNVKFATGFLAAIQRSAPAAAVSRESATPLSVFLSWRRHTLPSWLVVAAALWLVVCGALLFHVVQVQNEPRLAPKEASAPPLERDPEAAFAPRTATAPVTALVLAPQTRAIDPVPEVTILPGAGHAAFELRLDSNEFPRYEIELKDPASNRIVWRSGPAAATVREQTTALSVLVPARVLKPQHYSLTVLGARAKSAEVVGSYTFRVR